MLALKYGFLWLYSCKDNEVIHLYMKVVQNAKE